MNEGVGRLAVAATVVALLAVLLGGAPVFAQGAAKVAPRCPYVLDLKEVRAEIVSAKLVRKTMGTNRRMEVKKGQCGVRIAVLRIKITKPARKRLTLAGADLTLHYYVGNEPRVATCSGLSSFSASKDAHPQMELSRVSGPGLMKRTTGVKSTRARVIYLDAVFGNVNRDAFVRGAWVCIAQPTSTRPFAYTVD